MYFAIRTYTCTCESNSIHHIFLPARIYYMCILFLCWMFVRYGNSFNVCVRMCREFLVYKLDGMYKFGNAGQFGNIFVYIYNKIYSWMFICLSTVQTFNWELVNLVFFFHTHLVCLHLEYGRFFDGFEFHINIKIYKNFLLVILLWPARKHCLVIRL